MYCYSYLDVVLQVRCINFTVIEGPGAVHGPVNGFRGVGDGGSRDRDRVHYDAKSTPECASICSRSRLCDQGLTGPSSKFAGPAARVDHSGGATGLSEENALTCTHA
jgi:hypothetical protein